MTYEFGLFSLDAAERRLTREGEAVHLQPKLLDLLIMFIERAGHLVRRDEITARLAYPSDTTLRAAISELRAVFGPEGATFIETVAKSGYRFAAPVALRSASGSLRQVAEQDEIPLAAATPRPRWMMLAGGSVAAALVVLAGALAGLRVIAPAPHRIVAVLGFRNLSGRPEAGWLSTALAELIDAQLAADAAFHTIPGETVSRLRADLHLPESEGYSVASLARIRAYSGADVVVVGSFIQADDGSPVTITISAQDATTGDVLARWSETRPLAALPDVAAAAGAALRERLGARRLKPAQLKAVRAAHTVNPAALQLYAKGLERLRAADALGARDLLQQAVLAEPRYALAHSALAEAWRRLGFDTRATEAAATAVAHAGPLGDGQRLLVEARAHAAALRWQEAVAEYGALWRAAPDDVDLGLALAVAQVQQGAPAEALDTLAALRRLCGSTAGLAAVDLQAAAALRLLGRHEEALAAAEDAASRAAREGVRLAGAAAVHEQALASASLGRREQAVALARDAARLYAGAGDESGRAAAVLLEGDLMEQGGEQERARACWTEAAIVGRRVGSTRLRAWAEENLALLDAATEPPAETARRLLAIVQAYRELGGSRDLAITLTNLCDLEMRAGNPDQAEAACAEALSIARRQGLTEDAGWAAAGLATLRFRRGDVEGARLHAREAGEAAGAAGSAQLRVLADLVNALLLYTDGRLQKALDSWPTLDALAAAPDASGSFGALAALKPRLVAAIGRSGEARGWAEQSLRFAERVGRRYPILVARLALARAELDAGQPGEAERRAREVSEAAVRAGFPAVAAEAHVVRAAALLALGRGPAASKALEDAGTAGGASHDWYLRQAAEITKASVQLALGQPVASREMLLLVVLEAKDRGVVPLRLEATLPLALAEVESGKREAGRARLAALEKEARALGFATIAESAARARQ